MYPLSLPSCCSCCCSNPPLRSIGWVAYCCYCCYCWPSHFRRPAASSSSSTMSTFRFASSLSQHPSLYEAIGEVVLGVKAGLGGRMPDFCQLLITKAHARNIDHAPKCLLDKLTRLGGINSETLPVVMGGVTDSVSGAGEQVCSGSGVSLLAASLPGVELMPFHIDTPALPQLSAEQWGRLLTNVPHRRPRPRSQWSSTHIHVDSDSEPESAADSRPHNSTATLMLSAPHFTDVERLLQRFSNVLPGMPVLGGVTAPSAWGETEHSYGALFLGSRTFAQGAVGCVMHGPLAVQHLLVPGCRPVVGSRVMTVTANSTADPADILSLDGRPAQEPVLEFLKSQPVSQRSLQLQIGINEVGLSGSTGSNGVFDPRLFVARNMRLQFTENGRPAIAVATHEVPIGSRVQLLMLDVDGCQREHRETLRCIVNGLGPAAAHDPSQFGLLGYSCNRLQHDDSQLVEEIWPQVPFAGGRVQGEFGGPASTPGDAVGDGPLVSPPAKLHAFSASMGFICHQDVLQQRY